MKLLAFVDTHGNMKAIQQIVQKAKKQKVDVLVCAGDVSIFEQNIEKIFKKLNTIKKPILFVPGNHESAERMKKLCKKYKNFVYMNTAFLKLKDYIFLGFEGDGFSMVDPNFREWGKKIKKELTTVLKKDKKKYKAILITHAPPYNTTLDNLMGSKCGNKDIRKFIETTPLYLAISGHIHENAGKTDMIKKTKIVNPGPYGKVIIM